MATIEVNSYEPELLSINGIEVKPVIGLLVGEKIEVSSYLRELLISAYSQFETAHEIVSNLVEGIPESELEALIAELQDLKLS